MLRSTLVLTTLLVLPMVASAHGLDMVVKVANGTVSVTLLFDDDEPCANAVVRLLNPAGEVVAEGKSDAKGVCVFPVPSPGEYIVRAKAQDGHSAKQSVTITADPAPTESPPRPPRMLYLGLGLLGLALGFALLYLFVRRKRHTPPTA